MNMESGENIDPKGQRQWDQIGADREGLFFTPQYKDETGLLNSQPIEIPMGMPIEDYAVSHSIHISELWRLVRCGELIARPVEGRLYIFSEQAPGAVSKRSGAFSAISSSDIHGGNELAPGAEIATAVMDAISYFSQEIANEFADELPSLPSNIEESRLQGRLANIREISQGLTTFPEMALLLDHLSLAKEENKEIIKLAQDTIQRVTTMSENIVTMKNEIIEAKEAQIDILKERLSEQSSRIQTLNQEMEDLEMLARSITLD